MLRISACSFKGYLRFRWIVNVFVFRFPRFRACVTVAVGPSLSDGPYGYPKAITMDWKSCTPFTPCLSHYLHIASKLYITIPYMEGVSKSRTAYVLISSLVYILVQASEGIG